ncbi:MAG TPA: N-acetylmuramic acid 6-phosphate etherase [Methylomirabilota bacterium]|nr:N-acetylmuramic acid 6-phosphate etherase [Methylomirabilota bacterium]
MISAKAVGFLGIEGTVAGTIGLLADGDGRVLRRVEAGSGHLKRLDGERLPTLFRELAGSLPRPVAIAAGLAGATTQADFSRIRGAMLKTWPGTPCQATSVFATALACFAERQDPGCAWVVAGAGSACFGQGRLKSATAGGWGHWLGDKASGYDVGLRAVKAVLHRYDQSGVWPPLGQRFLALLQLNHPEDLIGWVHSVSPSEARKVGFEVIAAWRRRDRVAADIVAGAAASLAQNAAACARKVTVPGQSVEFLFAPGAPLLDRAFAGRVNRELGRLWPHPRIQWSQRDPIWGAVELARKLALHPGLGTPPPVSSRSTQTGPVATSTRLSPTEERNPRSSKLDRMPLRRAVRLMLTEDAKIPKALLAEERLIERAVVAISRAFRAGGRLLYVGAGTSGRLGVLDASECPPTFRSDPAMVQGVIAGGTTALWQSVEGAEDDAEAGAVAMKVRGVGSRDVVVGLAASGTTPFVWGALDHAIRNRATTILVCFNPYLVVPAQTRPTILIAPNLGPELLTGSTRLKAGTATKLLLNIFTTLAMVRNGKVISNLMVDLLPSNAKLRARAIRIVQQLTGTDSQSAQAALERNQWNIKKTISRRPR